MSVESVKDYLREFSLEHTVMELKESSATVDLAAAALGVEPARIAKTLSFRAAESGDEGRPCCILVVAAGDARIDGKKFRAQFGVKSKMLTPEEALACTGHAVGGVCPFAVENPGARVYLDVSLKRFTTVYPACGADNALARMQLDELERASQTAGWVDVCKAWREDGAAEEN